MMLCNFIIIRTMSQSFEPDEDRANATYNILKRKQEWEAGHTKK